MMNEQQERKNKRIAMITSVGIHALLLIAFFLMMAWRAPNPPLLEYGIELNFGMDTEGGGDIQPEKSPGTPEQDNAPQEEEKVETTQPEEIVKEEPVKEKAIEPVVSKVESPVVVKEEKKEQPKEVVKEKVVETKPKVTPKEEVKKEDKKEVKVTEEKGTDAKKGDPTTSQGDDKGKQGDKGNPEGKLDAKALYGKQGGGANGDNGFSLAMGDWAWTTNPKIPDIPDNQDGRIVFRITCDADGEITKIEVIESTLSLTARKLLEDEIRKNSLSLSKGTAPATSTGTVAFKLKMQ